MHASFAALTLSLGALAIAAPLRAQGTMRQLFCRGVSGIALKVDQDPSPRDPASVVMVLEYKRPTKPPGDDVRLLEPGTCTWNTHGFSSIPAEPGRVRFDVLRESQPWSATGTRTMDTTVGAARFYPDPISLPRYLNDPKHYWGFFVNDVTNLSNSFGALFDDGLPTLVTIKGPLVLANDVRRDLLCRGGSAGLRFGGGGTVGDNLARVFLTYRVSPTIPGPAGYGLSPGMCSWTDRTAMPPEPGTISFVTARNAQIRQAQSGSIDRSPTAAERYPDVFTIPEYLKDPQHYWTFAVMSRKPDSALTNGPWKRDLTAVIATGRTTATPTTVSLPSSSVPGGGVYRPGDPGSTTSVSSVFDIRNVSITPLLENAVFYFEAAPNITPTVTITPASGGQAISIPVKGVSIGTMWRYVGESGTPLARDTRYTYTISAPAAGNARANTKSGAFKTLRQDVTVKITQLLVISDGDASNDGELYFKATSCPALSTFDFRTEHGVNMVWKEGTPYRFDRAEMKNVGASAPDRFRVLVEAYEDDRGAEDLLHAMESGMKVPPCGTGTFDLQPGRNADGEWTSAAIDFDLTRYPGLKGGEQFVRRSKPLVKGVSVMFEIRGSVLVTRQ